MMSKSRDPTDASTNVQLSVFRPRDSQQSTRMVEVAITSQQNRHSIDSSTPAPTPSPGILSPSTGAASISPIQGTPGRTIPTTFTLFPKLSLELRLTIWEFALHGPRIVKLVMGIISGGSIKATSPIPALLHVNHEARVVALKKYKLVENSAKDLDPVYFYFDNDSLFIDRTFVASWFRDTKISRISNSFQRGLKF